jgi:hypothetical protein
MFGMLVALALLSAPTASAVFDAEADGLVGGAFVLDGTHGYEIAVTAYGVEGKVPGRAAVLVHRRREAAVYEVPAVVTADSVRADLGGLGLIDVTLHRSGHKVVVQSKCLREKIRYEPGVYEGTLRFEGEGGYTSATQTSARRLLTIPLGNCHGSGSGESRGSGLPGARLAGLSYAHGRVLKFQFNKNRQRAKSIFSASVDERRGDVRITRGVEGNAPSGAFVFADDLRSASLHPPAPFSGSATLHRDPNSFMATLSGDLRLHFPGRTVSLTGLDVPVSIVHARYTRSNSSSVSIGFPRSQGGESG